jgi:ubiquinone/menaquinone biosynthesis C-methylase UbiE
MELDDIKKHWDTNATHNKTALLSTTKTPTIKQLEIDAFYREIKKLHENTSKQKLLEVGCGNGYNLFGLADSFPMIEMYGVDYSEEMIEAANTLKKEQPNSNIQFEVADVLSIQDEGISASTYDYVITNRMLINLNSWALQKKALENLVSLLNHDGHLILIENFNSSYENQNELRELIGLPSRVPDAYNKFLDEDVFETFLRNELNLQIVDSSNFASLHDILLYVLIPHFNSGKVSYDHPIMESVTNLLKDLPDKFLKNFGYFGQNNIYVLKKK